MNITVTSRGRKVFKVTRFLVRAGMKMNLQVKRTLIWPSIETETGFVTPSCTKGKSLTRIQHRLHSKHSTPYAVCLGTDKTHSYRRRARTQPFDAVVYHMIFPSIVREAKERGMLNLPFGSHGSILFNIVTGSYT